MTKSICLCLGGFRWGVPTRLLRLGKCCISCRWSMLSSPHMHPIMTSNLSRTRQTTLATLKLGQTYDCIYQRGFWASSTTYRGFPWSILNMRNIVRYGMSESNMWCHRVRLFHMGLHEPILWTTCLGIMSINIHIWFRHKRERYHVVLYVFCLCLSPNLVVVVIYHIMYQV